MITLENIALDNKYTLGINMWHLYRGNLYCLHSLFFFCFFFAYFIFALVFYFFRIILRPRKKLCVSGLYSFSAIFLNLTISNS